MKTLQPESQYDQLVSELVRLLEGIPDIDSVFSKVVQVMTLRKEINNEIDTRIVEVVKEFDNLSLGSLHNGNIVVYENRAESPLIEMSESEWLENLRAIQIVLDWWTHEAETHHHWAFNNYTWNNESFNLPTIYMNRDNIASIGVDSFFYSELQAWHEIDFEELEGLPFITIDEEKAIGWLRMGDYGHTNIDDVNSFSDQLYQCDIHKKYSWADIPLDEYISEENKS